MVKEIMTVEAILLKSLPFKEYDKILTLYTKTLGLIKLYVKLSKRTSLSTLPLVTPFTRVDFQISKGRSDFFRFHDGTLLDQRIALRQKLEFLQLAVQLIELICKTQWPEQPSPDLYQLLNASLAAIPTLEQPKKILYLFYLKILKHEGVLSRSKYCPLCHKELHETFRFKGDAYCEKDAPIPSIYFSEKEELMIQNMLDLRNWDQLSSLPLKDPLGTKIKELFNTTL
jgi:DNA repair protein RecO (recombination protein O)